MDLVPEDIFKLGLAILLGGLIGVEREYRDKAAGFRTIIFICVGSTMFTILSLKLGDGHDPARIAAQIVSGVGFLGAGVILRGERRIFGLTTAATIWLAAALGMSIGGGEYLLSSIVAGFSFVILVFFPIVELWIDNIREMRIYEVRCAIDPATFAELDAFYVTCRLRVHNFKRTKTNGEMICIWTAFGSPKRHDQLSKMLFEHPDVKEFKY